MNEEQTQPKIATVERIISVDAHPNADRLDLVKILGYQCVTEKGLHQAGDLIIYIQPDSVLPVDAAWAEGYRKYSPGRIRAVKLRGEFSEGIVVKFEQVSDFFPSIILLEEGYDVAPALGITHYEPPAPQDLSAKGLLPFGIPKTDETRWENKISHLPFGHPVDVTLKIDGQSWSAYYHIEKDEFGVLGRTMEYKQECSNKYTAHVERYDVKNKLTEYCKTHGVSLAIRGESYGSGIQSFESNPHAKLEPGLALFSVYNITERKYERLGDKHYFRNVAAELDIPHVPIVEENVILTRELVDKYSKELKKIDGKPFEGVVINHGAYTIQREAKVVELPDGTILNIEPKLEEYAPNSFKVINLLYDSNK